MAMTLALGGSVTYAWLSQTHALTILIARSLPMTSAIVSAIFLTSLNLLLRWLRWNFLLRRFHIRVVTRDTFRIFFAMLWASATLLYLGEILRGLFVAKREGFMASIALGVWFWERCCDIAAMLIIWGVMAQNVWTFCFGISILIIFPVIIAPSWRKSPAYVQHHTAQLHPIWVISISSMLSLSAWTLPLLAMQAILISADVHVPFIEASRIFAKSTLLGAASGIPSGIGVTGSSMIYELLGLGVDPSAATASVFAVRLSSQWYATLLGVLLALLWRKEVFQSSLGQQAHFDALSSHYAQNIPEHIRQHLIGRKINAMLTFITPVRNNTRGLDLGCGHGWYAAELWRSGYEIYGIDISPGQIVEAKAYCNAHNVAVELDVYDGMNIPYPNAAFDFAYSINVLHHVPQREKQVQLLEEVMRTLRPGGIFLLHEINIENPIFRGYMSYLFPLLKSIDDGTELWLRPTRLPTISRGQWLPHITYFTFLPDFLSPFMLKLLRPWEQWLESSSLCHYSAHYMAVLQRKDA
jgi:SAM-dependent methyltransferase/uncharacterized membrane protein YbhN (UPF0104 family)